MLCSIFRSRSSTSLSNMRGKPREIRIVFRQRQPRDRLRLKAAGPGENRCTTFTLSFFVIARGHEHIYGVGTSP